MTVESAADLSATTEAHFAQRPKALELDASEYMDCLGDLDVTDAQKLELLEILWSIMTQFVKLGFTTDLSSMHSKASEEEQDE